MKTSAAILSILILAPVAAFAGTGTGAGTCEPYNPVLYTKGTTYRVKTKVSSKGGRNFTQSYDAKVIGPATFHGHKGMDMRTHVVEFRYPPGKVSVTADVFWRLGPKFAYFYGDRSQIGAQGYSVPPYSYPRRYQLNVPYHQTVKLYTVGGGTRYSVISKVTTTFLGMKRIKVPAGTFLTCEMRTEGSSSASKVIRTIDYSWAVASGRYAGLGVKSTDLESVSGSPPVVVTRKVALSVRVNGK